MQFWEGNAPNWKTVGAEQARGGRCYSYLAGPCKSKHGVTTLAGKYSNSKHNNNSNNNNKQTTLARKQAKGYAAHDATDNNYSK